MNERDARPSTTPVDANNVVELLAELRGMKARLDDIHGQYVGVDPRSLPSRDDGEFEGLNWTAGNGAWTVILPLTAEDRGGCVFVNTPHSGQSDIVAVPYAVALELAEGLLSARERGRVEDHGASAT